MSHFIDAGTEEEVVAGRNMELANPRLRRDIFKFLKLRSCS